MMHNPTEDILRDRAFPDVAAALNSRVDAIVTRWARAVREVLPAADDLTKSQLHDSVPNLIRDLVAVMSTTRTEPSAQFAIDAPEHGRVRYEQNFDLAQVMVEYSMLRRAVLEETTEAMDRPLTLDELMSLSVGLDVMIRRAVITFVNHLQGDVRADAENQSKYLSFLSHDLRGGLNGILLMIEVLKRELSTAPQFATSIEDLDLMRRSILDTVSTMDRFLHAERFRKGKIQLRPGQLNVAKVITDLVNQVTYQAREKGIDLKLECANVIEIISDKELLTMILSNLLANAVKFSRRGTVTVACALGRSRTPDGLLISVRDEGPGIARDRLDQLFAPFTRGDTHGEQGVGLGLSIAFQAAEVLHAKLWAESEVGKGTSFFVDVPMLPAPAAR